MAAYSRYLTFRLDLASAALIGRANDVYKSAFGLDVRTLRVLRLICEMPGVTASEIAARTMIEKTLLSKLLPVLFDGGLATREAREADRRSFALLPTEEGRRVATASEALGRNLEARMTASLDAAERDMLDRLLDKLIDGAQAAGAALDDPDA